MMKEPKSTWPSEFDNYLSYIDLMKHPSWKEYEKEWSEDTLKQMLSDMGADLEYGYQVSICVHRPRTENRIRECERVTFRERRDKYWVDNYMATEDIARTDKSSVVRYGMSLSLNKDSAIHEAMVRDLAKEVKNVDIVVSEKESK